MVPMTTLDTQNPEDLWKWMALYEERTGGKLLAIPHNGNMSNGRMFELSTFAGGPMTREWAEARSRWEPLFEVIQTKAIAMVNRSRLRSATAEPPTDDETPPPNMSDSPPPRPLWSRIPEIKATIETTLITNTM